MLPLVLLIWGFIGYRIYAGIKGEEPAPRRRVARVEVAKVTPEDTLRYQPLLHYPDPFLKNNKKKRTEVPPAKGPGVKNKAKVKTKVVLKPLRWPAVAYKGQLEKKGAHPLCILEIGNSLYFLKKGEQAQSLKLLSVYPDSVKVEYKKREKKTIVRS